MIRREPVFSVWYGHGENNSAVRTCVMLCLVSHFSSSSIQEHINHAELICAPTDPNIKEFHFLVNLMSNDTCITVCEVEYCGGHFKLFKCFTVNH